MIPKKSISVALTLGELTYDCAVRLDTIRSVDVASKANQATTYTITEVDTRLSGKQNTLTFRILRNWTRLFWGFLCYAQEILFQESPSFRR